METSINSSDISSNSSTAETMIESLYPPEVFQYPDGSFATRYKQRRRLIRIFETATVYLRVNSVLSDLNQPGLEDIIYVGEEYKILQFETKLQAFKAYQILKHGNFDVNFVRPVHCERNI